MAQRFNAPPGWQVPAGFVPQPGWQPDPSWPPAPAGWTFWVDAPAYGSATGYGAPSYGTPSYGEPSYGAPAYGAGGTPSYGAGYGLNSSPGSSSIDIARAQARAAQRSTIIGAVMMAAGLVFGILLVASDTSRISLLPLFLLVAGLVQVVRGVRTRSAALAKVRAMGGEYGVASTTIPGVTGAGEFERPGGFSTTDSPPPGVTRPGGDPLKW